MLVLTRKRCQSILIGDDIRITIVDTGRGGVRVGVEAPRDLAVDREEVRQRGAGRRSPSKQTAMAEAN